MARKGTLLIAAAAVAAFGGTAFAQGQSSLEQDAIAFGTREAVFNADLSPDGSHAVLTGAGPGRTTIVHIADIGSGDTKAILYSKGAPEDLQWCAFASDTRLVCRFTAIIPSDGSAVTPGVLVPASRMISLDLMGKDIKPLGQQSTSSDLWIRQFDGSIIDWLPGSGNDVLMTRLFIPEGSRGVPTNVQRTKQGVGVVRLNVETLATQTVEAPRNGIYKWLSDGEGHVRVLGLQEYSAETYTTGRVRYVYRMPGSREWKPLLDYTDYDDFTPVAVDASTNTMYSLRRVDGRWALTRWSLDDAPTETAVVQDANLDVDRVDTIGEGRHVIGYASVQDQYRTVYFDPKYKALSAALSSAMPQHPAITFSGDNADGTKVLLFAGSEHDPGTYYLFDTVKKSLGALVPVRPALAGRALASVRSVSYTTSDGTTIAADLLLPSGKEARGLPAVVLPGNFAYRDERGFDWLAQFFVARGYAVIEPRYRGFGGMDPWFMDKGFGGWRTSVGDLAAAAHYLIQQGIADPNRLAIVGWSYGGYMALLSAATQPSPFKAVVAIDPITDLSSRKTDLEEYVGGKRAERFIGDAQFDASPIRKAANIEAPVLLFHGTFDYNARINQSRMMRDALRNAGKQVDLVEFDGLDEGLTDSAARSTMLLKIGQLLDRTIGR